MRMKKQIIFLLILACSTTLLAETGTKANRSFYNQLLLGGGSSIKGFGDTEEEVRTIDLVWRHARIFQEKDADPSHGHRELWIEAPFSFLVSDSDNQDSNDIGLVGLNFLFAWMFSATDIGQPYVLAGGGPVLILADVDGVGSDLCGNYQAGCGMRLNSKNDHAVNLEIRYHHISNLGLANPNVPLNSIKLFIGFTF